MYVCMYVCVCLTFGVYVWHLLYVYVCMCLLFGVCMCIKFGVFVWYLVYVYVCEIWCVCVRLMCVYVCIHVFFRDCHLSFIFEKTKSINNDSIAT